jgi:hypothetical protein
MHRNGGKLPPQQGSSAFSKPAGAHTGHRSKIHFSSENARLEHFSATFVLCSTASNYRIGGAAG